MQNLDEPFSLSDVEMMEGRDVLILFWTKYFDSDTSIGDGTESFKFTQQTIAERVFEKCPPPVNRCRLTNNRTLIHQSEAVIFHIRDLNANQWPEFRSSEQRWIFWNIESPHHTNNEQLLKNLSPHLHFNWTFTYRYPSPYTSLL